MKYLLIDTATRFTHIAIGENEQITRSISEQGLRFQSEEALPMLISLMNEQGLTPSELDVILIGVGPGSFTGTRVGVAIGKTLGFAQNIPCIPFCSLLCYEPLESGPFAVLTDAKNQKTYTLRGKKTETAILYDESPSLLTYKEIEEESVKGTQNFLYIDPLPSMNREGSWKINLKAPLDFAHKKWALGETCKAQDIGVLYLRTQSDL